MTKMKIMMVIMTMMVEVVIMVEKLVTLIVKNIAMIVGLVLTMKKGQIKKASVRKLGFHKVLVPMIGLIVVSMEWVNPKAHQTVILWAGKTLGRFVSSALIILIIFCRFSR